MQTEFAKTLIPKAGTDSETIAQVESRMITALENTFVPAPKTLNIAASAAQYHLRSGGNRTRARICLQACKRLEISENDAITLSACVEMLHNASLIHDDLQDAADQRHGLPSVWFHFSPAIAICAGDLLISSAYRVLSQISQVQILGELIACVHESITDAIQGQCRDLNEPDPLALSFEAYAEIVKAKSGALLGLPLQLALIVSGNTSWTEQAKKAAADFSIGYQIADDLLDIEQDKARSGKPAQLNILLIAGPTPGSSLDTETARLRGKTYFQSAHDLAAKLPKSSGAYFQKLAIEMATFL